MKRQLLFIFLGMMLSFAAIGQITTVGLIGSATPNGWDSDIDMVQDATDTCIWTLDVTLAQGEAKFRANNDWAINWGSSDFPTGTGTQDGPNIPVLAGDYHITFNSCTGEYVFVVESPIGIIGSATPGGWDSDTNMFRDTTEHGFFIDIDLVVGEAKFRKDDDWTVNWGGDAFPTDTGYQDGPNIQIPKAGKYHVTFDTLSGIYNFTEVVEFEYISIIGSATPGGWDSDTDLNQNPNNPDVWQADVSLIDGELKFRANHDWGLNWGGDSLNTFPSGVGIPNGANLVVPAGDYRVTFNTNTLEFNFLELVKYDAIGLIGSATPGGWSTDTDMIPDPDSTVWRLDVELIDGEAKFRANHDWTVNWGSGDFPTGTGVQDGANIPVVAGKYHVTFNSLSGEYSFEVFVVYDQISIVGKDGPFGAWPDDTPNFDYYLTISPDDDQLWTGSGINLTTADTTAGDSGIKFRANTDWTVNWGARDFPAGVGTQDGPNIWCQEGVWDVTFNSATGEYSFVKSSAVIDVLDNKIVTLYPNPAVNDLNVDLSKLDATGDVLLTIFEMNGRKVSETRVSAAQIIKLDISGLKSGSYFLSVSNHAFMVGKKFNVLK
ncbi:MAG TPA: SusF/SusE family outer membrane protein [Bacteroidetes bacterium]|nr:SusF/SusE family outer membrane protein [Bacteroidota bacterium]